VKAAGICKDDIELEKKILYEYMDKFYLAQDEVKWLALAHSVIKVWFCRRLYFFFAVS
jgi:hypothetical protein